MYKKQKTTNNDLSDVDITERKTNISMKRLDNNICAPIYKYKRIKKSVFITLIKGKKNDNNNDYISTSIQRKVIFEFK